MSEAISPDDIPEAKAKYLPSGVIDTWNRVIASKYSSGSATVDQDFVVKEIMAAMGVERRVVFDMDYLEVEDLYRAKGWDVKYDKPGYNENYSAYFVFSKARK